MKFDEKKSVVASLWREFRYDDDFTEFMAYNDLGCPLAYMYEEKLITALSGQGIVMITETFNNFLELMDITEAEIDAALTDKSLGAIMVFSHNQREAVQD